MAAAGLALINTAWDGRSAACAMLSPLCVIAIAAGVYFLVGFANSRISRATRTPHQHRRTAMELIAAEKFCLRGFQPDACPASFAALLQMFAVGWRR